MLRRKGTGGRGGFGWVGGRYDAFPTGFNLSMYLLWLQPLRELGSTKKKMDAKNSHLCACSAYLVMMHGWCLHHGAVSGLVWLAEALCTEPRICAWSNQLPGTRIIFPCAKKQAGPVILWYLELDSFWVLGRHLLCETATEDVEVAAGWVWAEEERGYHHHVLA